MYIIGFFNTHQITKRKFWSLRKHGHVGATLGINNLDFISGNRDASFFSETHCRGFPGLTAASRSRPRRAPGPQGGQQTCCRERGGDWATPGTMTSEGSPGAKSNIAALSPLCFLLRVLQF